MANDLEKTIQLLDETTDAAVRAKVTLEQLVTQMMKNPSQTVQLNYADELRHIISLEEKRISLMKQANSIMSQSRGGATTSTTGGNATRDSDRAGQLRGVVGGASSAPASGEASPQALARFNAAFDNLNRNATDTKRAQREALVAQLKKERQAWLDTNQAMLAYAKTQGIVDPQKAYKSTLLGGSSGAYDISTFKERNAMGEWNTLKVKSDKQGQLSNLQPPKAQQSFAQGITKDIGDLLKWSVAIAAIYGPINAMSEAMTQLIENESKLADVSVFLSDGLAGTEKVFGTVSDAAQSSGESISGVIDAFGAAYTAAGRITDEVARYAAASSLLNDALSLSKLSTLDQAGAIDVLTAALYQTAEGQEEVSKKLGRQATQSDVAANALSNGKNLLDQWVLVSRSASVSVETLATGVAVLGDSAETAGLRVEQMNAMIATLSEVSLSSGKETANIAKALIGNYQQESAVKELNRLGIAVVDTTGKTRQFMDVMKDVYALRSSKILGDQDFNRLTLALGGGGIRRQKDVAAFIENMNRMEQLTKIQDAGAGGQTEAAMAKKLDTVQTSATQLQNAFVSLAQTMGTEGGLLDMFSGAAKGATSLVNAIDAISGAVGKVGPLLMAVGVGSLLMKGRGGAAGLQSMLMNNLGMGGMSSGLLTGTINPIQAAQHRMGYSPFSTTGRFGAAIGRATTVPSAAAVLAPAMQNLAAGDTEEAGANIAGGIVGALVAGPVGALVGSAIAEAFVRTTMTYDKSFVDLFSGKNAPETDEGGYGLGVTKKSLEELTDQAYKTVGSLDAWNEFVNSTTETAANPKERWDALVSAFTGKSDLIGSDKTIGAAAMRLLEKKDPEQAKALRLRMAEEGLQPEGYQTRQTKEQIGLSTPERMKELGFMQQQEMDRLKGGVISGDIKQSDYANRLASLSAFSTTATGWMAAATDESGKLNDSFKSNEDAYEQFLLIMGSGNQEAIKNINSMVAEMTKLQDIIDNWDPNTAVGVNFTANGQEFTEVTDLNTVKNALGAVQTGYVAAVNTSADYARNQNMGVRDVYGSNTAATSGKDINTVIQDSIKLQDQFYSNLSKEDYDAKKRSFEEFYVWVEDAGKLFYKSVTDASGKPLDKALFGEALQTAQKEGRISSTDRGMDWQVQSYTAAQVRDAERRAPAMVAELEKKSGGKYNSEITDTLVTTSDKQTIVSHGDQKVIAYLLQQILDTEKKQLQGIWNLPEGSSFWVPLQSMIAGDGAGGSEEVLDAGLTSVIDSSQVAFRTPTTNGFMANNVDEMINNMITGGEMRSDRDMPSQQSLHEDMLKLGKGQPTSEEPTGIIDQLMNLLRNFMDPMGPAYHTPGPSGANPMSTGRGPAQASETQPITTRLDLKFSSTTNLMVDGRTLATIVKPYLAADFMRANESGGTLTRSFVI